MTRIFAFLAGVLFLASCAKYEIEGPPVPLAQFSLGHNVVIASKAQKGPLSRDASAEEWEASMKKAIDTRFGRYEGDRLYHFGVSVEGYMLASRGVPLVATPKSALIVNVTVWDDAGNRKLNTKPIQFTIFENTTPESWLVGSGWGRDKKEQMDGLSFNTAKQIEKWLVKMHEENAWFTGQGVVIDGGEKETNQVQAER